MKKGFAFRMDKKGYAEFCGRFPYDMTEDQEKAENAVLADMESERPMDRLVCGDVGFGKTEIALRAACLAALNGKQTAVLAPTTLLAEQHFETFSERFSETGATVEVLSRFKTAKQSKEILEKLEAGTIDVIIGTHKLLSSKIQVQGPGAPHRGRGAPLRREAEGENKVDARRHRHPHSHRDAYPEDAQPRLLRAPRPLHHRDAAGGAPLDKDPHPP